MNLPFNKDHPPLKTGAVVRAWLPFPQQYRQQRHAKLIGTQPSATVLPKNGTPQRTGYFEQVIDDPAETPSYQAEFEFVTSADYPKLDPSQVQAYDESSELYREFTAPRPPHIVLKSAVQRLTKEIVGDDHPPEKLPVTVTYFAKGMNVGRHPSRPAS